MPIYIVMICIIVIIVIIGLVDMFSTNIKFKLIYKLVRYVNNKEINNIVNTIIKDKKELNENDIRDKVIANYLEKGHMFDSIAITLLITIIGLIIGVITDDEYTKIIIIVWIGISFFNLLLVLKNETDYIIEQKALLDLKRENKKILKLICTLFTE